MRSNFQKFIAFILGVLGSAALTIPVIALISLMCYCIYNCLLLNFPGLPVIYYHQWIVGVLIYYAINNLIYKAPHSEDELKFLKKHANELFIDRIKWFLILTLIAWIYGMVY